MGAFSIKVSRTCYSGKTFETFVGKLIYIFESLEYFCAESVQIRHFFWPVFFRIQSKYGKMRATKSSVFGLFLRMSNIYEN